MVRVEAALCVLLLCGGFICTLGDKHSLYYIYTALNKDIAVPGVYEFTAVGLLDDRAIDYYNSEEQMKVPKQHWMREKMPPDYWEKGTQSRKNEEQSFKVTMNNLMQRMNHSHTDLHVLQWRHGCEIDESNGEVKFLKGVDEYSYDGKEFLSFDNENMRWIALVPEARPTKDKWDHVPILNQYTKGYLEKECVDWLTVFMEYEKEALRKQSPPDVHMFAKKSATDSNKLTLTCLATGFYSKDMEVSLRKFRTSLPEYLLTSSGVRPNGDGTYQLRKSVDIQEDKKADYDCYVDHSTLGSPVIKKWDKHSLYYFYTVQSVRSINRISEFSVVTLLDDTQIDSYSSTDGIRTPKQDWLKKIKETEWKDGTDKLKYDVHQLNQILDKQMKAFKHDESDGHVLQWRNGCEGEKSSVGSVSVLNCISEYGFDGQDLISYNWISNKWSASVIQAKQMEEEWNRGPGDQKCVECEHWLKIYLQYSTTVITQTPPDVHMFEKKSATDSNKLILTCMATGFYPKDVVVNLRKFRTSLPEHLLTVSELRPNEDGTYQLRKSVDIQEDDTVEYDCYVNHISLDRPVIKQWEAPFSISSLGIIGGAVAVFVVVLAVLAVLVRRNILKKKVADPKNLEVVKTTSTSVMVQWEKARGEIDRYILLASPQTDGSAVSRQIEVPSGEDSAVIHRLKPDCLYKISLCAEKNSKQSRKLTVQATTMISDPQNLEVVMITPTSVTVKWEKAWGEIDKYILSASPQTDGSALSRQIEVSSGEDSAEIDRLEPGCLYEISLCAEKNSKQSQKLTVQATTVISGPQNLEVVMITPTSVKVKWEKAWGKIDKYILSASQTDGSAVSLQIEVSSGEDSAVIDRLDPGCLYEISLWAEKDHKQSWKLTVQATTGHKTGGSVSRSDSGLESGSTNSSRANITPNSGRSSDTGSRSSGSPQDSVENVDETSPMMQRTSSDPDRVADDPAEEEQQTLLSSTD